MTCRNCFRAVPLNDEGRCGRCVAEMIKMRADAVLEESLEAVFGKSDAARDRELRGLGRPALLKHCRGCEDDFYNGNNPYNVRECWSLKTAELVTRWRLGVWQQPTAPGAFTEVRVFNCRREKGFVFYKDLPTFAIDPVHLRISDEVPRV